MSWSISIAQVAPENVGDELRAQRDRNLAHAGYDDWAPEVKAQQELLIQLAERATGSGVVRGELLNVSVNGHAHDGSEYSANDMLGLNVSVSPPTP
jgi:hypothetical protein